MKRLGKQEIKITVILGKWARKWATRHIVEESVELTLPKGSTVEDILKIFSIRDSQVGKIVVDNELVERDFSPSEGDIIKIYPYMDAI